jgi:hypothetical protein
LTHEGARSIVGPYLGLLGASAATIGFVSGSGELIGYAFRLATGWITDKTKHYWMMAFIGYAFNLLAIPMLALVPDGGWIWACGLLILERFGKAIRHPAKNTMVSFAASEVGHGKGFAIQEALDQLGAFLGPVLVFGIMMLKGEGATRVSYALAFAFLGIMAIVTLVILDGGSTLISASLSSSRKPRIRSIACRLIPPSGSTWRPLGSWRPGSSISR